MAPVVFALRSLYGEFTVPTSNFMVFFPRFAHNLSVSDRNGQVQASAESQRQSEAAPDRERSCRRAPRLGLCCAAVRSSVFG